MIVVLATATFSARAIAASDADVTLAEALFQQGKALMNAGRYAEACPKLAESQRLDPAGGTLLALGLCHEGEGKFATAWAELNEALAVATRDKNDVRIDTAKTHIAAIEPKLPHVVVKVPAADALDGFALTIDGTPLPKAAWGGPIPIDPGAHEIRATAPKKATWTTTFEAAVGAQRDVEVAPLADAPTSDATPVSGTAGSSKRTIGWIVGGVSLVALGVGGYFGVRAISKRHESNDQCPADNQCTPDGKSLNDDAKSAATISTVLVGVGIAGAAVATWLVLSSGGASDASSSSSSTSTSSSWASVRVTPLVGPTGGALSIGGAF